MSAKREVAMTGQEKILAAFSPAGSPETPVVICYPGIFERDHLGALTRLPWWQDCDADPDRRAAYRAEVVRATELDWYNLHCGASRAEQAAMRIEVDGDDIFQFDRRDGTKRRLEPPVTSGTLATVRGEAPDIADIEAFLDEHAPAAPPYCGVEPGREMLPERLLAALPDKFPLAGASTPLWTLSSIMSYEQWFLGLAADPAPLERACARLLQWKLQQVRDAQALGARGIWIEDCLTDQIGPERFSRIHLPLLRALTDAIRAAGMVSIHYFCGNPWPVWDLLLDSGADALSLEESKKGFQIDIDEVVDRVAGRMVVFGNLDTVELLESAPLADLEAEIARQCAAGRRNGNRFVMSTGSPVTPATSVERVRFYRDCVWGRPV